MASKTTAGNKAPAGKTPAGKPPVGKTPAGRNKTQPQKKRNAYVVGIVVAIVLAVLTIIEYYVAILPEIRPDIMATQSPTALFLIAFVKAVLVVYFFMHVYRLWRPDDHADEGGH